MGILALALNDDSPPTTVQFDYSGLTVSKEHLKGTTPKLVEEFEAFCRKQQGRTREAVMFALAGYQFWDDSSGKKTVGEIMVTIPVREDPEKKLDMSTNAVEERKATQIKKDPPGILTFKQLIWN